MNRKSVLFIEPRGKASNVFENYMRLPLLGTLYLGTILHEKGYRVRILNENMLERELDPFEIQADVFCITALTVNANRAKLLASQLRKIYPASKIIVGGIHASLLPADFVDVADCVVQGECEENIVDIIEGAAGQKILQGRAPADLNSLPFINYGLLEGMETMDIIPIMTSRGCPFDCNFCTVTKIFGREFRMQTPERVVAEIQNALTYFKRRNFFFYDDNFTTNRKRMNELCDLFIERDLNISWAAQVRSDLARDPELIRKMVQAGCRWVYIGFESIDDATLKALHKSQTKADIEKAIRTLHEYGVSIHGMFMFGEDNDTVDTIARTVDFAIEQEIDTVQFMILTPFPGTQYYEKIAGEHRFLHGDWDYFSGMFIVFHPRNMRALTLQDETFRAYQRFYSLRRTLLDTLLLMFNVFLDAFVWNFKKAHRYNLDIVFMRGGAKSIVSRYSHLYKTYRNFLDEIEKKEVLANKVL